MHLAQLRIPLSAVALALLSLPPAGADELATARFGERVDVEVVNVDVVVTNREGRPILDLGPDDFQLRVDGKLVAIQYFAAPAAISGDLPLSGEPTDRAAAPETIGHHVPPVAPPAGPSTPTSLVVFVDQSALEWHTSKQIIEEIREYLLPRVDAGEQVFIAAFTDDLRILADGTSGRDEILAAIDEIEKMRGRGTRIASTRNYLERDIRTFDRYVDLEDATGQAQVRGASPEGLRSQSASARNYLTQQINRLKHEIEQYGREELDRQQRSLDALQHFVDALSPLDGRKAVLFATAGYTSSPTAFLSALLEMKRGRRSNRSDFSGADAMDATAAELNTRLQAMLRTAQNARVAFYTIAPRTSPVMQNSAEFPSLGRHNERVPPRDIGLVEQSTSIRQIAHATGGQALYVDDGLSDRLVRVDEDGAAVYSLGFPVGPEAGHRDHQIEVLVRRPDAEARHRENFRRQSLPELTSQAVTAAAALGAAGEAFDIALELGEPKQDSARGREWILPFAVRLPLGDLALIPDDAGRSGRLLLQVALREADGDLRVSQTAPIDIRIPTADLEEALVRQWVHRAELRLPAGSHRIAVVVTDEGSGLLSTALATIEIQ
jgi:VWFA-related protein